MRRQGPAQASASRTRRTSATWTAAPGRSSRRRRGRATCSFSSPPTARSPIDTCRKSRDSAGSTSLAASAVSRSYPDATDAEAVKRHRQDYGIGASIPGILDRDHRLVAAVGPRVTPEAAIYSPAGRLYRGRIDNWYLDVGRARREATQHDLRLALDAALAGRSIAPGRRRMQIGCVHPETMTIRIVHVFVRL